ncbi:Glutathione reductase [Croceitalea dokdonensis DOKDO 023]|uniref:Glutathione reductase n=1 Tax=Croceitalea dokdonensis DOKDO 023 TaxID=1300341 RepID=A0A0P7AZW5_9FLAO|nr:NAD(P)/FAD-dependent oxidoreductase [Croceitalea dokdonensis]KPM32158.1 Glutathione reductase [Croceitalea dokdonensis DOKDO 023]
MKPKNYDVFVIGSGSAGQTVAETCAKNGKTVAIADNRIFGGTCANRGCDPKKVLLAATEAYELSKNLEQKGIINAQTIDWKKLQRFKHSFTKAVPAATESRFYDLGIELYHQSPKFIDENTLSVEGKTIHANTIVIASGLVPKPLNFEGSNLIKTSDDFLGLKKIPKKMVFIGAGYIGMEFAHMAARAGSKVTVMEHGQRPLKAFDPDMTHHLTEISETLGIRFIFNSEVEKIKRLRKNYEVSYLQDGKKMRLKTRLVCNTAGRIPAIQALNLSKGKVAHSKKGVIVNQFLQNTTNPRVYACGDVANKGLPLTPLSGLEASIVAENILNDNTKDYEEPLVPSAVFTLPNLASVGLSEEEAKRTYKNVVINYESVPKWYNAKRINATGYAYKIISNKRTKRLLGAHLLSPEAAETINLFAMAIQNGMTTEQLKKMIFTYPTWCNDIKSML